VSLAIALIRFVYLKYRHISMHINLAFVVNLPTPLIVMLKKKTKEKSIYSRTFCLISVYINNIRQLPFQRVYTKT